MRTGSNPPDINQFRMNTRKINYLVDATDIRVTGHFPRARAEGLMTDHATLGTWATLAEQARVLALALDAGGVARAIHVASAAGNAETVAANLVTGDTVAVRATQWAAGAFNTNLNKTIRLWLTNA